MSVVKMGCELLVLAKLNGFCGVGHWPFLEVLREIGKTGNNENKLKTNSYLKKMLA